MATEAQKRAKTKYEKKAYTKMLIRFKKDQEQDLREAVERSGKSLNAFIVDAVMEATKESK